jgi:hypothetical protein
VNSDSRREPSSAYIAPQPHIEAEGREDKQEATQSSFPELGTPQGVSPSTPIAIAQTPAPEPPRTPSPPPPSSLPPAEEPVPAPELETSQPRPVTPPPAYSQAPQPQSAFGRLSPPVTRPSTPNAQFGTTLTAPRFGIATPSVSFIFRHPRCARYTCLHHVQALFTELLTNS